MVYQFLAAVSVILPQDASLSQQTAAEELREYCGKMGIASGTIELRTDESLGENGLFMHGMPLSVAPREQYEIPMLLWMKDDYRPMRSDLGEVDQHYVFHTVLNLMNVSTPIYDPQHDLLLSRDTE